MFVMPGDRAGRYRVRPGTNLRRLGNSSGGGLDLTTVNSNVGSFALATVTADANGRITALAAGTAAGINAWEAPFTKPTVAGVTRVNTTGFTDSDDTNGMFITRSGALSGTDNLTLAHNAIPAGNWDLIVRLECFTYDEQFACAGAHLYETATGKIIAWSNQATSGGQRINVNKFTNTTTFSAQIRTAACTQRYKWFKINYDGTNYNFSCSLDGYSWILFTSTAKASFFTTAASHAGFFLDPNNSLNVSAVKCYSMTLQ